MHIFTFLFFCSRFCFCFPGKTHYLKYLSVHWDKKCRKISDNTIKNYFFKLDFFFVWNALKYSNNNGVSEKFLWNVSISICKFFKFFFYRRDFRLTFRFFFDVLHQKKNSFKVKKPNIFSCLICPQLTWAAIKMCQRNFAFCLMNVKHSTTWPATA